MKSSQVRAVLLVKDLRNVTAFYTGALGMKCTFSDSDHSVLNCSGFELIVHQIPIQIAAAITIAQPPERRVEGTIRLDYPVRDISESRRLARSLGGGIDDVPPSWAYPNTKFFFGYDPEGNQFGVSVFAPGDSN